MMSTADSPIDATLIGTVPASGSVEPLSGGRLTVTTDERLEFHDRVAFLSGTPSPTQSLRLPPLAAAAPLPDGGVVVAEARGIRAVGCDGATRWEVTHAPWHGGRWNPRP